MRARVKELRVELKSMKKSITKSVLQFKAIANSILEQDHIDSY